MIQQSQNQTLPGQVAARDEHELSLRHFLTAHPAREIFGDFSGEVAVGVNHGASVAVLNPRWSNADFGIFKVPTLESIRDLASLSSVDQALASSWFLSKEHSVDVRSAFVPPETGRAVLLPPSAHPVYRDVLVKGTGRVDKFTSQNKLRFASRGFNGLLEISEAERDLVNTEILERAGMFVVAGVGVVDHHHVVDHDGFTEWSANYIRAFRIQTRISNLFDLDVPTMRAAIDDAMKHAMTISTPSTSQAYVEYFKNMLEICAKNVAIMQAIGFTQDSFHFGQVTLCGELADLGIGSFKKPAKRGEVNTLHPWFRFERQPILMLNMLYKTHAVKAEPAPVRLETGSRAVLEQQTLFGAIAKFSLEAALEIEAMNPEQIFWETYERTYRSFDVESFKRDVLSQHSKYFDWSPEAMLGKLHPEYRSYVGMAYAELLEEYLKHYEKQEAPWQRFGLTAIHQQVIFSSATRLVIPRPTLDFSQENIGFDPNARTGGYLKDDGKIWNREEDLSWKPVLTRS